VVFPKKPVKRAETPRMIQSVHCFCAELFPNVGKNVFLSSCPLDILDFRKCAPWVFRVAFARIYFAICQEPKKENFPGHFQIVPKTPFSLFKNKNIASHNTLFEI
jgi:hypothetical protein